MMSLKDSILLILRYLNEKKMRVFLTVLGIVIGIFTFTFFMFVSDGLSNAIIEQFSSIGTNTLGVKLSDSQSGPFGSGMTDTDIEKIKKIAKNYDFITPIIFYSGRINFNREVKYNNIVGYPDEYLKKIFETLGIDAREGRLLKPKDSGNILLGYKVAKDLFDKEIKVGDSIKIDDRIFRVIGIISEKGDLFIDNSIFMSFKDIKVISRQDTYSVIRITYLKGTDLDYEKEKLLKRLNPNSKIKKYKITSIEQVISVFNEILGLLTSIIIFISSVSLFVGGVNVLNTMYSNVLERTNEISVMKAIGARNEDVRNLFLIESLILGLIGSLLGFFSSFLFSKLLSYIILMKWNYNVPIYFNFNFFLMVIIGTSIFTSLFGTYPAILASKTNPADNLRDE